MKRALPVVMIVAVLAGCGARANHGFQDSPVEPTDQQDNRPPHIINMPDMFMNLAFKCNGSDGIYAHTRDAAPVIVPNDSNCPAPAAK